MWTWLWLVPFLILLLILLGFVLMIWLGGPKYGPIFAETHFVEVARGIAQLKAAALDGITSDAEEISSRDDPRALLSSANLATVYTIRQIESDFVHHISISVAGGYTARAVGETFILFVGKLLGVPSDAMALGVGRSTVHHAEFRTDAEGQSRFQDWEVPQISADEISAIRQELRKTIGTLRWESLKT